MVDILIDDEGDEEAEFTDLRGDALDVHAIEAVFDEVELASVVIGVVTEITCDLKFSLPAFFNIGDKFQP